MPVKLDLAHFYGLWVSISGRQWGLGGVVVVVVTTHRPTSSLRAAGRDSHPLSVVTVGRAIWCRTWGLPH